MSRKPDVSEEARVMQASAAGEAQTLSEKVATDESYEKRQMLWKGMAGAGRSWIELVQQ
jgi:hypothetical protein